MSEYHNNSNTGQEDADRNKENLQHKEVDSKNVPDLISEYDIYLFREGKHFTLYKNWGPWS